MLASYENSKRSCQHLAQGMLQQRPPHLYELQVGVQAQQVHQVEHHADLAHVARAILRIRGGPAVEREQLHAHLPKGITHCWGGCG